MRGVKDLGGSVKVGYGAGEFGVAAVEFFVRVYLLKLYVDVVGLSASLAGTVLALAVIWDAVTDPLMGEVSDRTRWRSGRRRPWIGIGALLTALTFTVLFAPPASFGQAGTATFLLLAYMTFNTALTVIAVPHAALGGELSSDPSIRNEIFGWRFLFANLGLVFGIVVPAVAAGSSGSAGGTIWLAAAVVVSGGVAVVATRGHDAPDRSAIAPSFAGLARSLAAVARCRPFRPLVLAYLVGSMGLTLNSSLALFYYEHRLLLSERQVFVWILLPFALIIALSIGGWVLLARRLGRRRIAFAGVFLLGVGTTVVYPLFPAGELLGPVVWGIIGGILVGSVFLFDATVADIVDWDEALTGVHREGMYFGVWRMTSKAARAFGLALTGFFLDAAGFVPGSVDQTETARLGIALAFGPGVGVLFVIAALIWLCVPLDEAAQARVQRVLSRRRTRAAPGTEAKIHPQSREAEIRKS
jgi:GPH family glycoside/pentoside/hexuronide:cation symporter